MNIRYAEKEDAPHIRKSFVKVVEPLTIYNDWARTNELEKYSAFYIESLIEKDPKSVAIAVIDEVVAGYIITTYQDGPLWIEWYGVDPDLRRTGVGKALLEFSIAELTKRKANKIWCDTRTNNVQSNELFEKLGFVRKCEFKNHWYGQDFYIWECYPS